MSTSFEEETLKESLHKLTIKGTLDAPGAMVIEDNFRSRVTELGGQVIADLVNVDYISSYGLRMLLVGAKSLMNVGGSLILAGPNQNVMQMLKVAGYDTMFPIYETAEEAINSLSAGSARS